MRSFAEMPVWLLSIYGVLFTVMALAVIVGYVVVKYNKDNVNRVFGGLLQIIGMFVSIPVFLIALITTVPTESLSSVSALNVVTEIVLWGSLAPLLFVPAFIIVQLIHEYYKISGETRSKQGSSISIFERVKVQKLAAPAVRSWTLSRADFLNKPFVKRVAKVR